MVGITQEKQFISFISVAVPWKAKSRKILEHKFQRILSPMPLTLTEEPNFLRPCLSATFQRLSFFYLTMGWQISWNRQKKIIPYQSKNMRRLKSVQSLHYMYLFLLLPSQISLFRYSSSVHKNNWSSTEIQLHCCYSSYNKTSFCLYSHILKK